MWPHIYWVGPSFQQSWASTALIKVPINSGHSRLTKLRLSGRTGSDYCSSPVQLFRNPRLELRSDLVSELRTSPRSLHHSAWKNLFFLTSHFYDLLFVFQIFLTFNLPGSDSLLSKRSHVPDPLLILFQKILGFQMHLPCKSFSTKDYGHV